VKWFVRNTPYACASFAFAFDEELTLPAGEQLTLAYRIVIADGAWTAERADASAQQWQAAGGNARQLQSQRHVAGTAARRVEEESPNTRPRDRP
jgi:hypothetical protein